MSGGAVKTSAVAAAASATGGAGNRTKLGGDAAATMGGESGLTEGDLPPTEDIRPDHVLR